MVIVTHFFELPGFRVWLQQCFGQINLYAMDVQNSVFFTKLLLGHPVERFPVLAEGDRFMFVLHAEFYVVLRRGARIQQRIMRVNMVRNISLLYSLHLPSYNRSNTSFPRSTGASFGSSRCQRFVTYST